MNNNLLSLLLEPFQYEYMFNAIWVTALIGGTCAFLSCFLMLKGWSLMGDALSHSVVPGVATAYALSLPYAFGAFFTGILAAILMIFTKHFTRLREDAVIGFIFSTFFAIGLLIISLNPTSISVQTIIFGNILGISHQDIIQVIAIISVTLFILLLKWQDLMLIFFDEQHARSIGFNPLHLKILFFILLSACTVAALQTVGVILVVAMVITPGATAYQLTDRFPKLILIAVTIGALTSAIGAYLNYFLDVSIGGFIVTFQTLIFLIALFFAPKHGIFNQFRKSANSLRE